MEIILFITASLACTLIFYIILIKIYGDRIKIDERINSISTESIEEELIGQKPLSYFEWIGKNYISLFPHHNRLVIQYEKTRLNEKYSVNYFYGFFVNALLGLILIMYFLTFQYNLFEQLLIITMTVLLCMIVVNTYIINKRIRRRMKGINQEMSDFFDLLSVSIEAGLGFDIALKKVCTFIEGEISYEFGVFLEEIKYGKRRKESYENLSERIDIPVFKDVISNLITAEQLGSPITQVLFSQAQIIRDKQASLAEEKAMKAPVKIMIPVVFFIFPTLLIFILAPAFLTLL